MITSICVSELSCMPYAHKFTGLLTALPTPLNADGTVRAAALKRLVEAQVDAGVDGLVPMGGTGEFTALTPSARAAAVETTIAAANGIPVVPGIINPGFGEAVEMGKQFQRLGAKGLMVITPFYVRPTQEGVRDYYKAYRDKVDLPIVVYDIPRFTNTWVDPETFALMVEDGSIDGLKACNTDFNHYMRVCQLVGDKMSVLSGEDRFCPLHMSLGGVGGVLASATLVPWHWKTIIKLLEEHKFQEALAEQYRLWPLFDAIYRETNPGPMKTALDLLGIDAGEPLLPLKKASDETCTQMAEALRKLRENGLQVLGSN